MAAAAGMQYSFLNCIAIFLLFLLKSVYYKHMSVILEIWDKTCLAIVTAIRFKK